MNKKLNKILILIIILATALAIVIACGGDKISDVTQGNPTGTPTATPTAEPTATPTPSLSDILPQQTIVELNVPTFEDMPDMFYLGSNKVLVTWRQYSGDEYSDYDAFTYTAIYDFTTGTYTQGPVIDYQFMFVDSDPVSGKVLGSNYAGTIFYIMDSNLNVIRTIEVEQYGSIFNSDFTKYYYTCDGYIYEGDVASGTIRYVEAPYGMRVSYIDSFDFKNNIAYMAVNTSLYKYGTVNMIFDIASGQVLSLNTDTFNRTFAGEASYSVTYEPGGYSLNKYVGGTKYSISPISLETGNSGYRLVMDSPYFARNYTYNENGEIEGPLQNKLYSIEGDKLMWCDFTSLYGDRIVYFEYIEDSDMILSLIEKDGKYQVAVLRVDLLQFTEAATVTKSEYYKVEQTIIDNYLADLKVEEIGQHLAALRVRADELEDRFGFTILMSNQCIKPLQNASYTNTYTNTYMQEGERDLIAFALNELEQMASKYPEGFFEQFKDKQGNGGVYIYLIGGIESTNNTIAYFYKGSYFYNIAIDITYQTGMEGTFSHELWHAIEAKISQHSYEWQDGWDALNPQGFEYYETYNYIDNYSSHWTYYDWSQDGIYFVDSYAKTFAKEDRARIFEKVMGDVAMADQLMLNSAMKAKIKFMCEVIEKAFDTSTWGDEPQYWERYN